MYKGSWLFLYIMRWEFRRRRMVYGRHVDFPRWFSAKNLWGQWFESGWWRKPFPGAGRQGWSLSNPYLTGKFPKYPETLEPEETAGPSTEKATTYASQPSPDFKIRNDTNSQPVNRSNLQWSGKKLRKGGKSITLIRTACQSDNSTLRTKL